MFIGMLYTCFAISLILSQSSLWSILSCENKNYKIVVDSRTWSSFGSSKHLFSLNHQSDPFRSSSMLSSIPAYILNHMSPFFSFGFTFLKNRRMCCRVPFICSVDVIAHL